MDNQTIAAQLTDVQFEHEGKIYEIVLPRFNYNKTEYTAKQAAANAVVREALVVMAWESNEANTPREESEFDENGILKIVY